MTAEPHIQLPLPPDARPAIDIVKRLTEAGYLALLNGGCVRDLLRGDPPHDYDVATSAPPEAVLRLFPRTRHVGVQFGVVLVTSGRRWVEVATFRTDGEYRDGRRPESVEFTDAEHDAQRRDFTVNGMFLEPLTGRVIDYVGGLADLQAGVLRAIGEPERRFAEDYLRMLRAVRFAARLSYAIEPKTWAALVQFAPRLTAVAAERVREELEKMLLHPSRAAAFSMLAESGLLLHLWPGSAWSDHARNEAHDRLARLRAEAAFESAFAVLMQGRETREIERITRGLAFSNEQRAAVLFVAAEFPRWSDPAKPSLAELKRMLASPYAGCLIDALTADYRRIEATAAHADVLRARIAAVPTDAIAPPPLVLGDDLLSRGVPQGPQYKRLLDLIYTAQLNEEIATRDAALRRLDELLANAEREPEGGCA